MHQGKVDDEWVVLRARVSFGEEPQKRNKVLREVGGQRKNRSNENADVVVCRKRSVFAICQRRDATKEREVSFAYASKAVISGPWILAQARNLLKADESTRYQATVSTEDREWGISI